MSMKIQRAVANPLEFKLFKSGFFAVVLTEAAGLKVAQAKYLERLLIDAPIEGQGWLVRSGQDFAETSNFSSKSWQRAFNQLHEKGLIIRSIKKDQNGTPKYHICIPLKVVEAHNLCSEALDITGGWSAFERRNLYEAMIYRFKLIKQVREILKSD